MGYDILLTGANRGLGLALTEQFLEQGHRIFALRRHESSRLAELQVEFPQWLHQYACDVSDEASIRKALELVGTQTESLDILINNAAVHLDQARLPLEQVDFSVYLPAFQTNTVGPLMVVKYALPFLRKGEAKLIVNVSSEAGSIGACWRKSEYSYCMTKSALNMGSRILQNYLQDEGIQVLAVHPGWFTSDMGGVDAPISPADAAHPIIQLILHPPKLGEPMYLDADRKAWEW